MTALGKTLILLGGILVIAGVVLVLAPRIPLLGKLPGDLHFKKGNVEVFVPLATSIVLSLLLTGIFWIINHLGKK